MRFDVPRWQRMISRIEQVKQLLTAQGGPLQAHHPQPFQLFPCQQTANFVNGLPCPGFVLRSLPTPGSAPERVPCACQGAFAALTPLWEQRLWERLPNSAFNYRPSRQDLPDLAWTTLPKPSAESAVFNFLAILSVLQRQQPPHPLRQFEPYYSRAQNESLRILEDLLTFQEIFISPSRITLPWMEAQNLLQPEGVAKFKAIRRRHLVTLDFSQDMPLRLPGLGRDSSWQLIAFERFIDELHAGECALIVFSRQPLLPRSEAASPTTSVLARSLDYSKGPLLPGQRVNQEGKLRFASTKNLTPRTRPVCDVTSASTFDKLLVLLERGQHILDQLARRAQKLLA